jgi:hypothetical protein
MKTVKIQGLTSLREEMKAVERGERPAPRDASKPTLDSVEAARGRRSSARRGPAHPRKP